MSRSGYSDGLDEWAMIRWRGAVKSAIRGARGRAIIGQHGSTTAALFATHPDHGGIVGEPER